MVRDAPVFAEIADSFMTFMGDGIFVAHNVNFDYGFISNEYERLERRFRFPKLCTCAGMRRKYPAMNPTDLAISVSFTRLIWKAITALCMTHGPPGISSI